MNRDFAGMMFELSEIH